MTRVLVTCRDAGAAFHLIEIVKAAFRCDDLDVHVHAQRPAFDYFERAGIPVHLVDLPRATERDCAEARALLSGAREILRAVEPDRVLSGLSTPFDGGIDEAVVAECEVPSFVMQDFWGEVNAFFGAFADVYLCLDDEAVRLSGQRHGVHAVRVGSPRHAPYARIDYPASRRRSRAELGIAEDATVIGFFGQNLHALEGYARTAEAWAEAVNELGTPAVALYRAHPRESDDLAARTFERIAGRRPECVFARQEYVEDSLLACDVVCSAFSNCTYDSAYLNRFSAEPMITPVSLFFDPMVKDYFQRIVRLREFPYLKAGLVVPVRSQRALASTLARAATSREKARLWNAAQTLDDPVSSSARVLDLLRQGRVGAGGGSSMRGAR